MLSNRPQVKKKSLFTLIELLIVISIIVLLMGLASSLRLPSGVSEVTSALSGGVRQARSISVKDKESITIRIFNNDNIIRTVANFEPASALLEDAGDEVAKRISYPAAVTVTMLEGALPGTPTTHLTFLGDGTLSGTAPGHIVIAEGSNPDNKRIITISKLGFLDLD